MAKLSFTKLNAKLNTATDTINFNNSVIEIKQYLPISKKMEIVNKIVNECVENNSNYYNSGIVEAKQIMAIIENYTNLTFTEKQKEDLDKLYDIVVSSGLAQQVILSIPDSELNAIEELLKKSLENIYAYNNSIVGIL